MSKLYRTWSFGLMAANALGCDESARGSIKIKLICAICERAMCYYSSIPFVSSNIR